MVEKFFGNRASFLAIIMLLAVSCTISGIDNIDNTDAKPDTDIPDNSDSDSAAGEITERANREFTHYGMSRYYLWNEAYMETNRNFKKSYDDFLDDVLQQMHDKGQNLKDGHDYSGKWSFYSYIDRYPSGRATRAYLPEKEAELGLGMYNAYMQNGLNICFVPLWVYPDSPAAKAGIERGSVISAVDGVLLTERNMNNYVDIFYDEFTSRKSYELTVETFDASKGDYVTSNVKIEADYYFPTPILFSEIYEVKGKTVGYMVYNSFDAAYDDDFVEVFNRFRAAGVGDVILDLRYNGGGYVTSSRKMSSILGGSLCGDKTFVHYLYNAERMKSEHPSSDIADPTTYPGEKFDAEFAGAYDFGNLYVIGTVNTASASELLINALRGVDKRVTLVANERTNGKDVGMEVLESSNAYDGYYYVLTAITFQTFNAKGESDFDDGFVPDIVPDKVESASGGYYTYDEFVPEDWGRIYFDGDGNVLKLDYLVDALADIVGGEFSESDISTASQLTRANAAVERSAPLRLMTAPATRTGEQSRLLRFSDPRRTNMIKYAD